MSAETPTDNTPETASSPEPTPASSTPVVQSFPKIEVIFKAVGDAPIMKQSKWTISRTQTVGWVNGNIRKYLKLDKSEMLVFYVRQSFAPSPDQTIENLYECFGAGDGKLIMHYSKSQAWG